MERWSFERAKAFQETQGLNSTQLYRRLLESGCEFVGFAKRP
jgi:hypothetical protein